jgi:peptidoglycan hydrolase-like protein with peptidoglycan-binding domain
MRRLIAISASLFLMTAAFGAAKKKSGTGKKSTSTAKKLVSKKGSAALRTKGASKKGRSTSASSGQTWRSRQLSPTPDRYREIQQALVEKGYLKGEPSGRWDDVSADALRRFQQEQNLEPTGKINSLSLIALGLGPRHDSAAVAPPRVPARP